MSDASRHARIADKLHRVWVARQHLTFGQLMEQIEDEAWRQLEAATMREFSARWMHLPDQFLEQALDTFLSRQ